MINRAVDKAIYEAIIKCAVLDVIDEEMEAMPSDEELAEMYPISPVFDRKMKKLIKKNSKPVRKPIIKHLTRAVACLFIILGISFSGFLTVSAVRLTIFDIIAEWFETRTTYGDGIVADDLSNYPSYIPEGFSMAEIFEDGNFALIVYANEEKEEIKFRFSTENQNYDFYIDNEQSDFSEIIIGGTVVHLYKSNTPEYENHIMWQNDTTYFRIDSLYDCNELMKIAESIIEK